MADIIDFKKYAEDKEIDMYTTEDKQQMCIACPECVGQEFSIFLDNTIQCAGCELLISLEFSE